MPAHPITAAHGKPLRVITAAMHDGHSRFIRQQDEAVMRVSVRFIRRCGVPLLSIALVSTISSVATASSAARDASPVTLVSPARTAPPIRVIAACTRARYKPRQYVMTCADAGIGLNQATYQWWTRHTAHGHGTYYFNDCRPSCARGKFHTQRAAFTLYRVVKTAKFGPLFTRIEIDTRQGHHVFSLPTSKI